MRPTAAARTDPEPARCVNIAKIPEDTCWGLTDDCRNSLRVYSDDLVIRSLNAEEVVVFDVVAYCVDRVIADCGVDGRLDVGGQVQSVKSLRLDEIAACIARERWTWVRRCSRRASG